MNRVVITGGSGYIGLNLIRRLIKDGYEVYAVVRSSKRKSIFTEFGGKLHIAEWNGSTESMHNIFENIRPQAVLHLASLFLVEHKSQDILPMIQSNIALGTVILDACQKFGVKYFINTATHWQHYKLEPYNPANLYAATKQAFEDLVRYFIEACHIKILSVKIIDTYGPFDPRGKVVSLFKRIAESGETLDMSPGGQELGLVYIDDVINAFMIALQKVEKIHRYESFIVAPPMIYTLREAAKIFEEVSTRELNIEWGARPYRKREMMKVWTSEKNILEGQDALDLRDGLAKMLKIETIGEQKDDF